MNEWNGVEGFKHVKLAIETADVLIENILKMCVGRLRLRTISPGVLALLKQELEGFDRRSMAWRPPK